MPYSANQMGPKYFAGDQAIAEVVMLQVQILMLLEQFILTQ